jgi:predicted nucleic acid-binding protein
LALNKKVQLWASAPILEEYERVLLYPRLKFNPKEVAAFLARLRSSSLPSRADEKGFPIH